MARPLRIEFPGALYVVTARTLPRQRLFRGRDELHDFLGRLPALHEALGALVHGFCVLPSHYHLILETPRGNLARVVHRLNAGYTATVNARRRRRGPLLQSRYRAVLLGEEWLAPVSVHVHLNPVRRGLAPDPWSYEGSSAGAYGPERQAIPGLETQRVLGLAGGREAYVRMVEEGVRNPPPAPWKQVWRQVALGGEDLRQRVSAAAEGRDLREISGFGAPVPGATVEDVVRLVSENTGLTPEQLRRGKFQRVLARKVALDLARRFTGATLREIGREFGVDYTTVHMAGRRVEDLRRVDAGVAEFVRELETQLQSPNPQVEEAVGAPEGPGSDAPAPPPSGRPARARKKAAGQLKLF